MGSAHRRSSHPLEPLAQPSEPSTRESAGGDSPAGNCPRGVRVISVRIGVPGGLHAEGARDPGLFPRVLMPGAGWRTRRRQQPQLRSGCGGIPGRNGPRLNLAKLSVVSPQAASFETIASVHLETVIAGAASGCAVRHRLCARRHQRVAKSDCHARAARCHVGAVVMRPSCVVLLTVIRRRSLNPRGGRLQD